MKYTIYCLLTALWLAGKDFAQDAKLPVKPLTAGDTPPDMVINSLYITRPQLPSDPCFSFDK